MRLFGLALLAVAAAAALADWWAVWNRQNPWRPVTKPTVMLALIAGWFVLRIQVPSAGPLTLHAGGMLGEGSQESSHLIDSVSPWVAIAVLVAALLSLLGDVLLLPQLDVFVAGLVSFLLAHLAYVGAFVATGVSPLLALASGLVLLVVLGPVLARIVRGVRRDEPPLVGPVVVYAAVIIVMAACAIGSGQLLVGIGALAFVASDMQLALSRFVAPKRILDLGCIATYHLAQGLLILFLV